MQGWLMCAWGGGQVNFLAEALKKTKRLRPAGGTENDNSSNDDDEAQDFSD
jgi:hypothetical protein